MGSGAGVSGLGVGSEGEGSFFSSSTGSVDVVPNVKTGAAVVEVLLEPNWNTGAVSLGGSSSFFSVSSATTGVSSFFSSTAGVGGVNAGVDVEKTKPLLVRREKLPARDKSTWTQCQLLLLSSPRRV